MPDYLRITYVSSAVGRSYRQKRVIKALGLRRLHYSRVIVDSPSSRGMINKVKHLLKVEPVGPEVPMDDTRPEKVEEVVITDDQTDNSQAEDNAGAEKESNA